MTTEKTLTHIEYKNQGNKRFGAKKYQNAIQCYDKALALKPDYAVAWQNKGLCYIRLNQSEAAKKCFEKTLEHNPNNFKAHHHLGKYYFLKNEFSKALEHYIKAHKATSDNADKLLFEKEIERCYRHSAATVSYLIADLKLTKDNKVVLLEMALGRQSGLKGLLNLKNDPTYHLKRLKTCLSDLNSKWNVTVRKEDLLTHALPPQSHNYQTTHFSSNIDSVANYRTVTTGTRSIYNAPVGTLPFDANVGLETTTEDKCLTHELFKGNLQQYRPPCMVLPRKYSPQLANQIKTQLIASRYVLKTPDQERGIGTFIVDAKHLAFALELCLTPVDVMQRKMNLLMAKARKLNITKPTELKHWFIDTNRWKASASQYFIVESYVPSKTITYKNQKYDATLRAGFLMVRDQGKITLKPLLLYWKLPPKPINKGTLEDSTKSSYSETHYLSMEVAASDAKHVWKTLNDFMPRVFSNMLTFNFNDRINREENSQHAQYLATKLSNAYVGLKNFKLAEGMLKKLIQDHPNDVARAYHELGILYHLQGKPSEAIDQYNKAIDNQNNKSFTLLTYYRRAVSYFALRKLPEAKKDLLQIKMAAPSDQRITKLLVHIEQIESENPHLTFK